MIKDYSNFNICFVFSDVHMPTNKEEACRMQLNNLDTAAHSRLASIVPSVSTSLATSRITSLAASRRGSAQTSRLIFLFKALRRWFPTDVCLQNPITTWRLLSKKLQGGVPQIKKRLVNSAQCRNLYFETIFRVIKCWHNNRYPSSLMVGPSSA